VRLPHHQEHQEADSGCGAAAPDGYEPAGKGRPSKETGRKSKKATAAAKRRGPTVKEKAYFVFKHRHLIVKRRENLTESERGDLTQMLE